MKELLSYIKAKGRLGEPAILKEMISKFQDKDVEQLIQQLKQQGMIWEPRQGLLRSLDQ